jgi:nitroreductase
MELERRRFMEKALAVGAGAAALFAGLKARAKGLPSDPGAAAGEAGPDVIVLPAFEKNSSYTLDQALSDRKSSRNYDPDLPLTKEEISRLMWACNGVNRPDGHRTTPSAVASYPVDVYAALPEGVYLFELKKHQLKKVLSQDIRGDIPIQPGFRKAGMIVLYVANPSRLGPDQDSWADLEIGCMVQDVYLEAAALKKGSCVFALVRKDKVTGLMGLKKNQTLKIAQAVGNLK